MVSTTLSTAPWKESTTISGNVVEEITKLKQQPGKDIVVDGSASLVQSLMRTDLIDEYRFLVQPFVMGKKAVFSGRVTSDKAEAGKIAARSAALPDIHRDPVDRVLVATAIELDAALATKDSVIATYPGVRVLWQS